MGLGSGSGLGVKVRSRLDLGVRVEVRVRFRDWFLGLESGFEVGVEVWSLGRVRVGSRGKVSWLGLSLGVGS